MNLLRKKSLSSPDLIRRSIAFRKIRFFQMDARGIRAKTRVALLPAHDGVAES
jgi:hypothetical protein